MKFDRRDFIKLTALGGATFASGSLLQACGSDPQMPGGMVGTGDWWTSGNYAPVMAESDVTTFEIEGEIPASLDGMYLRNGPNPPTGKSANWFFGDGMLHGFRIEAGKMSWYKNRYIHTQAFDTKATSAPNPAITANLSNTALVHHAGKLLSLYEGGRPYQVEPKDLTTVGEHDFEGRLRSAVSPHPKVDPDNGEMHLVGYSPAAPFLTHHVVDGSGALIKSRPIDLPRSVMVHDFQLTKNYVVIMDLPVVFDLNLLTSGGFPFAWRPENGARIGVLSRNDDTPVRWFDIASCYVFHTVNAYEDEQGRIVLDVSRHDKIWATGPDDISDVHPLWQYQIDLTADRVSETQVDDANYEFPVVDVARAGRASRYGYGLEFKSSEPGGRKAPTGLLKYDLKSRMRVGALDIGGGVQPDEMVFVPAVGGSNEDDGYLVGVGGDAAATHGRLLIADARTMTMVAQVKLPVRVPFGFHGTWIPGDAFVAS